jgi:CubicO group peptidase (beta-lactamase class C family)
MVLSVKVSPDSIGGDADQGYGKLADAFRRNMASGREIGAAVAVYRDGKKVVDLWGGYSNGMTTAPWQENTAVVVFSTTKGVSSLTVAVAASRGLISYDAKVADYWPEFAQAGKESITVRQLLAHQAGLPVLDQPLTLDDLANPVKVAAKTAAQAPVWTPGERHGYHAVTLGWYESELIRRADPAGRTLGRYFAEEIAAPLGVDFSIGLPASADRGRLAHLHGWRRPEALLHLNTMPAGLVRGLLNPFSLTGRAFLVPGLRDPADLNRDELLTVEIPAANGIGTARSLARLYGCAAAGGAEIGLTPDILGSLANSATPPVKGLRDKVLHIDSAFALGFCKPFPKFTFGSSDNAFGTPGTGGSFGMADPDTGIGFGYVMNRLGFHPWSDPRERALRDALFHDILGTRPQT